MRADRVIRRRTATQVPISHSALSRPRAAYPDFDIWWEKVVLEDREVLCLETEDGEIRGVAVLAFRTPATVKLCTFSLVPDEKRIGAAFLDCVLQDLRARGVKKCYATVPEGRADLHAFFTRSGFDGIRRNGLCALLHETPEKEKAPDRVPF